MEIIWPSGALLFWIIVISFGMSLVGVSAIALVMAILRRMESSGG